MSRDRTPPPGMKPCMACGTAGCSYCGQTGYVYENRHAPFTAADTLTVGLGAPPQTIVALYPQFDRPFAVDTNPAQMADLIGELLEDARFVYEVIVRAGKPWLSGDVNYWSGRLEAWDRVRRQILLGRVKPLDLRGIDADGLEEAKAHQAFVISGLRTQLACAADYARQSEELLVDVENEKVARWASRKGLGSTMSRLVRSLEAYAALLAFEAQQKRQQQSEYDRILEGVARELG